MVLDGIVQDQDGPLLQARFCVGEIIKASSKKNRCGWFLVNNEAFHQFLPCAQSMSAIHNLVVITSLIRCWKQKGLDQAIS